MNKQFRYQVTVSTWEFKIIARTSGANPFDAGKEVVSMLQNKGMLNDDHFSITSTCQGEI